MRTAGFAMSAKRSSSPINYVDDDSFLVKGIKGAKIIENYFDKSFDQEKMPTEITLRVADNIANAAIECGL